MQRWAGAPYCGSDGEIRYRCTTPPAVWGSSQHDTGAQLFGDGINYLDRFNVDCAQHGAGKVMSQWDMDAAGSGQSKIKYTCVETHILSTRDLETACDLTVGKKLEYLDRHTIDCGSGQAIQKWRMASCDGTNSKFTYTCALLALGPPSPPPSPPPPSPPPSPPPPAPCQCYQCGSASPYNFGAGTCAAASSSCSATVSGAGCYGDCATGCDCGTLKCL